jgi:predicted PurR-regulated permease PerM
MHLFKTYQKELLLGITILGFSIAFFFLYGLILPFILGLILAFASQKAIRFIQKLIKSKALANSVFLALIFVLFSSLFLLLATFISQDFKRLNQSFDILLTEHQDVLDEGAQYVKEFLQKTYDISPSLVSDSTLNMQNFQSVNGEDMAIDTQSIEEGFNKIFSFLSTEDEKSSNTYEGPSFSIVFILFSTLGYFILILYQMEYFTGLRKRYFDGQVKNQLSLLWDDFNQSFVKYFKLRTQIISLLMIVYLAAFIILDIPGIILLSILVFLLSYIPYIQYFALIPLALSSLVLSLENGHSFWLYFGIIIAVFIVASILEELILNPKIMEKKLGMNPVIMVFSLSIWGYVLGWQGLLIGLPLSSFILIYIKRYWLNQNKLTQ